MSTTHRPPTAGAGGTGATTRRTTSAARATGAPIRGFAAFPTFAACVGVGVLHAVDDAVLNRQPGVPVTQHLAGLVVVTLLAGASVWLFRRSGTGGRAFLALTAGSLALVNGAMHVIHMTATELSGSDVTGAVAAVAGAVLLVMAVVLPFVHRGERDLTRGRRWAVRGVVAAALVVLVPFGILPIAVGIGQTHLYRSAIGEPPESFEPVAFSSTDGLRLSGWYKSSRNGAAVVIVASARGDRLETLDHAQLLADHGFGVLVYDARGTGQSEGSPNGYGWEWSRDVSGALDFLEARSDVEPGRIGGLGLSTGADVLIETAAEDRRLAAVVGDGATGRSLSDIPPGDLAAWLQIAPVFATAALFSGERPGEPLAELVARVAPTPLLLVAAGSMPMEVSMNRIYADAANEPVELWTLPHVNHTAAVREEAAAYEAKVVQHLEAALLD